MERGESIQGDFWKKPEDEGILSESTNKGRPGVPKDPAKIKRLNEMLHGEHKPGESRLPKEFLPPPDEDLGDPPTH